MLTLPCCSTHPACHAVPLQVRDEHRAELAKGAATKEAALVTERQAGRQALAALRLQHEQELERLQAQHDEEVRRSAPSAPAPSAGWAQVLVWLTGWVAAAAVGPWVGDAPRVVPAVSP